MTIDPLTLKVRRRLLDCYRKLGKNPTAEQCQEAKKDLLSCIEAVGPRKDEAGKRSIAGYEKLILRKIGEPTLPSIKQTGNEPEAALKSKNHHQETAVQDDLRSTSRYGEVFIPRAGGYQAGKSFCGVYDQYPDHTGQRIAEGGRRTEGVFANSKSGEPLVSVVTVVYNNEDTLQRCIDSVKQQTYKNIEYIIIDGGSGSPTIDLILNNAKNIAYFISEPDQGIYSAMNKGIRVARGDYVCLLNSDDYYEQDFVERSIDAALSDRRQVDIVYTDYRANNSVLNGQPVDEGILFGHLNVCHNTFLVSKDCYDRIGPYDETLRIVSDAVWMRRAYLEGARFKHVPHPLFSLSDGGLSSGQSDSARKLFIQEVVDSYRCCFPALTEKEAESIYLFRFNRQRASELLEVARNHSNDPSMMDALRSYVGYCMCERNNFRMGKHEAESSLIELLKLGEFLRLEPRCYQIETEHGQLADVLARIDNVAARKKNGNKQTILHFITVFSAPSETFVYDLLHRLEAEDDLDNFVLYEHSQLPKERPYKKAIQIFWNDFSDVIGQFLYKYIVQQLKPNLVLAHFAINERKWSKRMEGSGVSLPTISMCHGVDVFSLRNDPAYKQYICQQFDPRQDTAFTVVSEYLRNELLSHGVDDRKIYLVPNTVNERFFAHRKTGDFYNGDRTLRLLCIGRLIACKGHRFLIDAIRIFGKRCTERFELTLVYGYGDDELTDLKRQIADLKLDGQVFFEPFVDFHKHPDYLSQFDCYLHPSTYTTDDLKRSETFGVAVLEAIAAGLPVITTDAGGLPEVVGEPGRFAHVTAHANAEAMAEALEKMWRDGSAFSDNRDYAKERLSHFSSTVQVRRLRKAIDEVLDQPIQAALFTTSTIQGAGYAAYRLNCGLRSTSVRPRLFTTVRNHESQPDVTVIEHPWGDHRRWSALQLAPKPGHTIFTFNVPHISSSQLLRIVAPYDVINVHWHARFLSIENIATLTNCGKPVVMTIRDMMPITGGCHCFHGCEQWMQDCGDCPQIPVDHKVFPASVLRAKRKNFNFENLTLVALSNHTRDILERSPNFRDCRIEVIPNSIELEVFRPRNKQAARKKFGLPEERLIIGYVPSYSSEAKGYRELISALSRLDVKRLGSEPVVMLVGNETPATQEISLEKKALGYIADNERLSFAYSAADVVVVPSLEETFSNTTAEAIACGVPVVGFKTGAIPDLAINGLTGYCCEVGDVNGLSSAIEDVLTGPDMSRACREHAVSKLEFHQQALKYETLFKELTTNAERRRLANEANPKIYECFERPGMFLPRVVEDKVLG